MRSDLNVRMHIAAEKRRMVGIIISVAVGVISVRFFLPSTGWERSATGAVGAILLASACVDFILARNRLRFWKGVWAMPADHRPSANSNEEPTS